MGTPTTIISESSAKPNSASHQPPIHPIQSHQTGWLCYIPPSFLPYIQLMRLDRPNGFWYFYLPHLFGTLHTAFQLHASLPHLLHVNLILLLGTLFMRGATCTWNDTVDAPFDRLVPRCANRPVARGAVSPTTAHVFTFVQSIISLMILSLLPPLSFVYAVPAIVGWMLYPLAKRVTDYPQVVLGFPMAWGVFMGSVAMGANPLELSNKSTNTIHLREQLGSSTWALYTANVLWTLLYEIIYSHQDAAYDMRAGVKNIVVLYQGRTKPLLVKLAIGQVFLLAYAGWLGESGWCYWMFTVVGTAATLAIILKKVNLEVPENCSWWFKVGCCGLTGGAMTTGLIGDYLTVMLRE